MMLIPNQKTNSSGLGFSYKTETKRVDINYSGGGLVSIKKELPEPQEFSIGLKFTEDQLFEASTFSLASGHSGLLTATLGGHNSVGFGLDNYLNGDVCALAETFDVDLFDTLPTPVEEIKSLDLMSGHRSLSQNNNNSNNFDQGSMNCFQDLSEYVTSSPPPSITNSNTNQTKMSFNNMDTEESLCTPVVDLAHGPFYSFNSQRNQQQQQQQQHHQQQHDEEDDDMDGSPNFGAFSLPSTVPSAAPFTSTATMASVSGSSIAAPSAVDQWNYSPSSTITTTSTSAISINTISKSYQSNTTLNSATLGGQQQLEYPSNVFSPVSPVYQRNTPSVESTVSTTYSSISSSTPTPTYTPPSVTPSTSGSSLPTYTELKPRAESLTTFDVPTVVNDHPYAGGLSTSSSFDTKDFMFNQQFNDIRLRADSVSSASSSVAGPSDVRRKNNEASKKSRLTKKQKYEQMVREQERLEKENAEKRQHLEKLEMCTKRLKDYLFRLMATGGAPGGSSGGAIVPRTVND